MKDIELKIKQVISKISKLPEKDIMIDSPLVDVGIDSFAGIELVYSLEDMFSIKISDDEMKQMKTVKDIVKAIKDRLSV